MSSTNISGMSLTQALEKLGRNVEALADASTLVKAEAEAESKLKGKRKKNKSKAAAIALACRLRSNLEVCNALYTLYTSACGSVGTSLMYATLEFSTGIVQGMSSEEPVVKAVDILCDSSHDCGVHAQQCSLVQQACEEYGEEWAAVAVRKGVLEAAWRFLRVGQQPATTPPPAAGACTVYVLRRNALRLLAHLASYAKFQARLQQQDWRADVEPLVRAGDGADDLPHTTCALALLLLARVAVPDSAAEQSLKQVTRARPWNSLVGRHVECGELRTGGCEGRWRGQVK